MGQVTESTRRRRLGCIALFLCLLAGLGTAADETTEYQVKAAFLLNFSKFVEWPPSAFPDANAPMTICVLGDDPFGTALDRVIAGDSVDGRRLAVQRLKNRALPPKSCQVLFVSASEKSDIKNLAGLEPGVLTVGEGANFVRDGGMIGFVLENRRVRFDINQTVAESAGLKLSSKLLSVARRVERRD